MKMADIMIDNEQRQTTSEPQEIVEQQGKPMKLIGKRRVNIKANGKPKVTERVFRIIVEVECNHEEDVTDIQIQTPSNAKLALTTGLQIP